MMDIQMCTGHRDFIVCPIRDKCVRHMNQAAYWQAWGPPPPDFEKGNCELFMEVQDDAAKIE